MCEAVDGSTDAVRQCAQIGFIGMHLCVQGFAIGLRGTVVGRGGESSSLLRQLHICSVIHLNEYIGIFKKTRSTHLVSKNSATSFVQLYLVKSAFSSK